MPKRLGYKNIFFYPILAIYIFYPLLYIFRDCYGCGYRIINNYEHITRFLWILLGIFAGLALISSAWLRKKHFTDNQTTLKHILFALLLFLLFYPYMMAITLIDLVLFGLRW